MTDKHEFSDEPHTLDFMEVFDGSQIPRSPEELASVASEFSALVDDVMLRYIDFVGKVGKPDAVFVLNEGKPKAPGDTILDLQIPGDSGSWLATARRTYLQRRVDLIFTDADGHERESFAYMLGDDNVVRRSDSGDDWAEEQAEGEHSEDDSHLEEESENDQQIGLDELHGLVAFLASPDAQPQNPSNPISS